MRPEMADVTAGGFTRSDLFVYGLLGVPFVGCWSVT